MCASAPSLRVFFRRYLGVVSYGSRRTRDTNTDITGGSHHITVKKDMSVTIELNSTESTERLGTTSQHGRRSALIAKRTALALLLAIRMKKTHTV
jgi:hypothetical protein